MKIYVASLADYNNGTLFGQWFDVEAYNDESELFEAIEQMLLESPYLKSLGLSEEELEEHGPSNWTEYAVHDFEDCPNFLTRSEYPNLEDFYKYIDLIDECRDDETAVEEYIDHVGWEYASARDFSDKYMGKYNSEGDFMEELAAETMEIPENLWRYIDFEKMAVDYFIDDFFMTESGYVFRRF